MKSTLLVILILSLTIYSVESARTSLLPKPPPPAPRPADRSCILIIKASRPTPWTCVATVLAFRRKKQNANISCLCCFRRNANTVATQPWTNPASCDKMVTAVSTFFVDKPAQLSRAFVCLDTGSTNGLMAVVGTAATAEDAAKIKANFEQSLMAGALIASLFGIKCSSPASLSVEGKGCNASVVYNSVNNARMFRC